MNAAKWILLIGVVGGGMVARPGVARAQTATAPASSPVIAPTSSPVVAPTSSPVIAPTSSPVISPAIEGDNDKPWNHGVPTALRRAARDRFVEGNRLFNVPLFAQAARQYEDAIAKWKHPAFYFNLAFAQLNLGQDVEAHASLEHALEHGSEVFGADQVAEARRQLQELERHLGRIRISCETSGAEVTLDGATVLVGPGSAQSWVKPAAHELTAKKTGYLAEARRVPIAAGQLQVIDLKLVTLSEATDTGRRWAAWKPWAVVIAGGAIAAGGGVLHALSARGFNDFDSQFLQLDCAKPTNGEPVGCQKGQVSASLNNKLSRARREQQIAVGGYIAGGALIATGIVLVIVNRPHLLERTPGGGELGIAPVVSPDMVGLVFSVNR